YIQGRATHAFLFDGQNFSNIDFPSANNTSAFGINNGGMIVGTYSVDHHEHGFVLSNGVDTTLDPPGEFFEVELLGINNAGGIGGIAAPEQNRVYGLRYGGGVFKPVKFPGAGDTVVSGLNDNGVIVGSYEVPRSGYCFTLIKGTFHRLAFPG